MPRTPRKLLPTGRRGFTLIEVLIAICVAAILVGVTVPSFTATFAKGRLEGALNGLSVDLQYARSQSIRTQRAVTLQIGSAGNSYTISDAGGTLKTVTMPAGVSLTPSVAVSFDALRGMAGVATIDGSARTASTSLRVSVNAMGRTQLCVSAGAITGVSAC